MNMENELLKELLGSQERDIVINMDSQQHWSDHIRALNGLRESDLFYEKIMKSKPKVSKGRKCFLSYRNRIYAWLEVYSVVDVDNGVKLQLFPYVNFVFPSLENNQFSEEFRYYFDNHSKQ